MSLTSRKQLFLSKSNTQFLIKKIHALHINDGGSDGISTFAKSVPSAMRTYCESNTDSKKCGLAELVEMDVEFVKTHKWLWLFADKKSMIPTAKMYASDYGNLDLAVPKEYIEIDQTFRRFNVAKYAALHARNVDYGDDGRQVGRSLDQPQRGYDMSRLHAEVERPYQRADALSAPLLYDPDYDSTTALT